MVCADLQREVSDCPTVVHVAQTHCLTAGVVVAGLFLTQIPNIFVPYAYRLSALLHRKQQNRLTS